MYIIYSKKSEEGENVKFRKLCTITTLCWGIKEKPLLNQFIVE